MQPGYFSIPVAVQQEETLTRGKAPSSPWGRAAPCPEPCPLSSSLCPCSLSSPSHRSDMGPTAPHGEWSVQGKGGTSPVSLCQQQLCRSPSRQLGLSPDERAQREPSLLQGGISHWTPSSCPARSRRNIWAGSCAPRCSHLTPPPPHVSPASERGREKAFNADKGCMKI